MDFVGGFYEEEKDGKQFLIYYHPKYNPIPQTQNPSSSGEAASHDQPLFTCPGARFVKGLRKEYLNFFPLNSSPEYVLSTTKDDDHSVLPLFWCNNKEFDDDGGCWSCRGANFGTDYYFCDYCNQIYHKECVESPPKIKHPYHPEHYLQLYFVLYIDCNTQCLCCGCEATYMVYYCTICQIFMHLICAMKPIPFVINQPKRHNHPLTLFPRQTSLTCNVCGLLRKLYPTYICAKCNFVAHNDCMYFPRIIKISRHYHHISYTSPLPSRKYWSCGVCRQSINSDYGAYSCDKCSHYAVHSICALGKNVWDGKEFEVVQEENDITKNVMPFNVISEGVIVHFFHPHHLMLEVNIFYEENRLCQACVLPIYEGNLYSCRECNFFVHETCTKAHWKIQHALHPHQLTLRSRSRQFRCDACDRVCTGFVYECCIEECTFNLDVRCASIAEPFDYKFHEHPLFLALDPVKKPICHVCKMECHKQLNCIKCDFVVCIKCVTLPYKVKYKHDKHFLTIFYGEAHEEGWCDMCERSLKDTSTKVFYWCNECCTTLHIECLIGEDPYIKPGRYLEDGREYQVLSKSNLSRPLCHICKDRCQGNIFKRGNTVRCSMKCLYKLF